MAASEKKVPISQSALATGFDRVTVIAAQTTAMRAKRRKRNWVMSLARRVRRVPEQRRRVLLAHQPVEIVDEVVAGILRVLVVLTHVDRLHRAHLLAHPAEDAAELVDLVH